MKVTALVAAVLLQQTCLDVRSVLKVFVQTHTTSVDVCKHDFLSEGGQLPVQH